MKKKIKKIKKNEQKLKISGNFSEVLKVAVKDNPQPKKRGKYNGKNKKRNS